MRQLEIYFEGISHQNVNLYLGFSKHFIIVDDHYKNPFFIVYLVLLVEISGPFSIMMILLDV